MQSNPRRIQLSCNKVLSSRQEDVRGRNWIKKLPQQKGSSINMGTISILVLLSWLQGFVFSRVYRRDAHQPSSLLGLQEQRQQPLDLVLTNQITARLPGTSVHHSGLHKLTEFMSASQLAMCLFMLYDCVAWEKSIMKVVSMPWRTCFENTGFEGMGVI